ncbi:MAG: tetratricopeptide repeat protein [Thermodesulfovibrionales bacterium]
MVCRFRSLLVIVVFVLMPLCLSVDAKIWQGTLLVKVTDRDNHTIFTTYGRVLDDKGLVITDIKAIQKWLDDVSNNLMIVDRLEKVFVIDRLISTHTKGQFAIFSIETKGAVLTEKTAPMDFGPYSDVVNRSIAIFKKVKTQLPPQKKEESSASPPPALEIPKLSPSPKEQGRMLFLTKRYQEAEALYLKVLEANSNDIEALRDLALISTFMGRFEDAQKYYQRIITVRESVDILKKLSNIYIILGQYNKADKYLQRAILLSPFDAEIQYNMAILTMLLGDKEQAFNQYIRLNNLDREKAEEIFDILYR